MPDPAALYSDPSDRVLELQLWVRLRLGSIQQMVLEFRFWRRSNLVQNGLMSSLNRADRQPPSQEPTHPLAAGLNPFELAERIRESLYEAKDYARWRRKSWRALSSGTHLLVLVFSATATIILGLAELNGLAQWGFIFSALVTTLGSVEPFFNWRSRWVLAEEALSKWHRIEEDLTIYVAETKKDGLDEAHILTFYDQYCQVWNQFSNQWLEQRRSHP